MALKIFVSYRREDSEDITGRIRDRLADRYGESNVFLDIDSIPLGEDFRDVVAEQLAGSMALLAVIGPKWTGHDHDPPRIHDDNDFVRVEVAMALGSGIPVVPVFVGGASMSKPEDLPAELQPLCFKNGLPVRTGRDFKVDISRLTDWIDGLDNAPRAPSDLDTLTDWIDGLDNAPRAPSDLDTLTGLLNRKGLAKELEARQLTGKAGICAIADIDRFKIINDAFGHNVGDEVIRAVAEELKTEVGSLGTVARTGGEEFLVRLLPECTRQGTEAFRAFLSTIPERLATRGLPEATCTIGLSLERFDAHDNKVQEALMATYTGKIEGGNRLVQISAEESDRAKCLVRDASTDPTRSK